MPGWQRRLVWLCARSAGPTEAARCWLLSCGVSAPLDEAPAMALPPALDSHWQAAHTSSCNTGCMHAARGMPLQPRSSRHPHPTY